MNDTGQESLHAMEVIDSAIHSNMIGINNNNINNNNDVLLIKQGEGNEGTRKESDSVMEEDVGDIDNTSSSNASSSFVNESDFADSLSKFLFGKEAKEYNPAHLSRIAAMKTAHDEEELLDENSPPSHLNDLESSRTINDNKFLNNVNNQYNIDQDSGINCASSTSSSCNDTSGLSNASEFREISESFVNSENATVTSNVIQYYSNSVDRPSRKVKAPNRYDEEIHKEVKEKEQKFQKKIESIMSIFHGEKLENTIKKVIDKTTQKSAIENVNGKTFIEFTLPRGIIQEYIKMHTEKLQKVDAVNEIESEEQSKAKRVEKAIALAANFQRKILNSYVSVYINFSCEVLPGTLTFSKSGRIASIGSNSSSTTAGGVAFASSSSINYVDGSQSASSAASDIFAQDSSNGGFDRNSVVSSIIESDCSEHPSEQSEESRSESSNQDNRLPIPMLGDYAVKMKNWKVKSPWSLNKLDKPTKMTFCRELYQKRWKDLIPEQSNNGVNSSFIEDTTSLPKFVFSFSLFRVSKKSNETVFRYYVCSALDFIAKCRTRFKNANECRFIMHVNDLISDNIIKAFLDHATLNANGQSGNSYDNIEIRRYKFSGRKRGCCWLVNAMRFSTLWEHEGPETVVVCDIHDDIDMLHRQVIGLDKLLQKENKEIVVTYWKSDDEECISSNPIPIMGHHHIDGGVVLWRDGKGRKTVRDSGDFKKFCSDRLTDATEIPRGVDEMLVDAFLQETNVYQDAIFLSHMHCIRPVHNPNMYSDMLFVKDGSNGAASSSSSSSSSSASVSSANDADSISVATPPPSTQPKSSVLTDHYRKYISDILIPLNGELKEPVYVCHEQRGTAPMAL